MTTNPWTPPFEKLPATIPIFPLPNAVVMPGCQLPLNIFEPRYLRMVLDAMGGDRMIGMVQPIPGTDQSGNGALYPTGTAGRISSFTEVDDGRLSIVLTGVCRFDLGDEIPAVGEYRKVMADWSRFASDYVRASGDQQQLEALLRPLKAFFTIKQLETDWNALENVDAMDLADRLIGMLPFDVAERQLLIETIPVGERVQHLISLLEHQGFSGLSEASTRH